MFALTTAVVALACQVGPDGPDVKIDCGPPGPQAETTIDVDPNDPAHLVGAAIDWSAGAQQILWFTTFDGGGTWSCGWIPVARGYVATVDPTVKFDTVGGVHLVLVHVFGPGGNQVAVQHSSDGGLTFPTATVIDVNGAADQPQLVVDTSGGPHHGDIAVLWGRFGTAFGTGNRDFTLVAVSSDHGQNFGPPVIVNDPNSSGRRRSGGGYLAYGPGSELYVAWADWDVNQLYLDVSFDGGATFGSDLPIAPYTPLPGNFPNSSFANVVLPVLAVDTSAGPYRGNLYVAWPEWDATLQRADILCANSSDQGATFSTVVVNQGDTTNADQFMPEIATDPLGNVQLLFSDRRLDPSNDMIWEWAARSSDGGTTFEEAALSDVGFNHRLNEFGGVFIGHYNSLATHGTAGFTCFADCRSGTSLDAYLDVFDFGFQADEDQISAATGGSVNFAIHPGPLLAGGLYWLLAGASGSDPGIDLGPIHLPLNFDAVTDWSLHAANSPLLPGSFGTLGATGGATARLDTLAPFDPALAGLTLTFAAVAFDPTSGRLAHATRALTIALVP